MVYLDVEIKRLIEARAQRLGVSEAKIIREALRRYLTESRPAMPRVLGRSVDGGVARDLDAELDALGFGSDHAG